ncbi:hypothetical protein SAMN04487968_11622 [Nocardioides terrae]|uniref:Uncharacterized protein n=1 Tax=Nocardioides terrae TaxID=574651 RepID=A0A1I1NCL8_9ACTN|nr:hypothetical protein [Nocardioides terrae]SFC95287.1 hypothetical protein SAMN04487968_11622 [Nocardioides terrae]
MGHVPEKVHVVRLAQAGAFDKSAQWSILDLDGLVLYDIDDERSRNPVERPFPFSPTIDPSEYRTEHLEAWRTPAVVYRAVGKYQREELRTWLSEQDPRRTLTVLVGSASSSTRPPVSLADAQRLRAEVNPELLLGGVAIPERHSRRENEHLIENDLRHSANPLSASLEQAQTTAVELIDYCRRLGVPCGLNVESVSIRREEIDASVDLAARLATYLRE